MCFSRKVELVLALEYYEQLKATHKSKIIMDDRAATCGVSVFYKFKLELILIYFIATDGKILVEDIVRLGSQAEDTNSWTFNIDKYRR